MRVRVLLFIALVLPQWILAQASLRPDVPIAIVGGMLLDGYEAEPVHDSVVVFEDGIITAVGERHDTEIPSKAVVIEAGGRTDMPGLILSLIHI